MSHAHPPASTDRAAFWTELRAITALSAPIAFTNLAQLAMGTTDVLMMGRLGADTLAAGTLGVNLYVVFMIFGVGLMAAAPALIATTLGRDRDDVADVRRTVQQACWACVGVSVPSWLVLWWAEPLLRLMGQDANLAAMAGTYVRTLQWSMLPFLMYLVLRAFVGALERPMVALVVGVSGVLINALGNWCLLLGQCGFRPLGIAGSGIATTIADIVMFGALAVVVARDPEFKRFRLHDRFWQPDWDRLRTFLRLGLPMAATTTFEVSIFNAAVFMMGLIGAAALAAHSIAIQIAALAFMMPLGFGQAATVRVGLAYGAGDREGIGRAGKAAVVLAMGFAVLMSLTMLLVPRVLIGAFLDPRDPVNVPIMQLAVSFLAVAALFQIADGMQAVGAGMLRGLHDSRVPMVYALLGYWGVGLPLGALLAFRFGFEGLGIWIGLATGLGVVAAAMNLRWMRRERLGLVSRLR